ncbi:hypothetical protein TgHK011_002432 [Trichoderma gracile]|nr:hypothetical protein TgHK011_002432 [Trichoderma gracile]
MSSPLCCAALEMGLASSFISVRSLPCATGPRSAAWQRTGTRCVPRTRAYQQPRGSSSAGVSAAALGTGRYRATSSTSPRHQRPLLAQRCSGHIDARHDGDISLDDGHVLHVRGAQDALVHGADCFHHHPPRPLNLIPATALSHHLSRYLRRHIPYFVLLGTTSATAGFANILTVAPSRKAIGCCRELETFECAAGLLGVAQLGTQWLCFTAILILFLIFFRYREANVPPEELGGESPRWQTAVAVGGLCMLHALIVIVLTGVFAIARPDLLNFWANFLGVMAAVLAAIQYIPQIWMTYHLKHVGSLSIPMMCIQTPGGLLFAASLFMRLGMEGWSTWAIYLLTAAMQGAVLAMGIYYEVTRHSDDYAHSYTSSAPQSPIDTHSTPQRPYAPRTYSEGWERGLPGPFTGHPERYAETEEDLDDMEEREERAIARENQPLLRPGGIGNPHKSYHSTSRH